MPGTVFVTVGTTKFEALIRAVDTLEVRARPGGGSAAAGTLSPNLKSYPRCAHPQPF